MYYIPKGLVVSVTKKIKDKFLLEFLVGIVYCYISRDIFVCGTVTLTRVDQ